MARKLHLAPTPAEHRVEPAARSPIRVILADDHPFMRRSLRQLLEREMDIDVVAEAADLPSATRHVHGDSPDVLVLDVGMQSGSSIEALRHLSALAAGTQIVVLTMQANPGFARQALASGALGFVLKEHADSELPQAVRAAARGEEYVSPRVAGQLGALHRSLTDGQLTLREVDVLRLIALGHTSVEIARRLHLSPRTVESHRARIHNKLGLATRAELVRYALGRGLLET
jgi:two-component system response regulator NreC